MNKGSKDWKKIPALLGNLADNHKDVLFSMVVLSIVKGTRPFISVILMGILDILSGCEEQKDFRSCKQQQLYEREFAESAAGIKTVVDKMAHFNSLNIFSQRSISALTGFLVYAFAGLLACAGMISVGGVVTYAASILKFTEVVGRFVYVLSWLGGNVAFAGDYINYRKRVRRKRCGVLGRRETEVRDRARHL